MVKPEHLAAVEAAGAAAAAASGPLSPEAVSRLLTVLRLRRRGQGRAA